MASTSSMRSARSATSTVTRPVAFTSAKSRTRRRSRLAMRGVPRERLAISSAPPASIATFSRFEERCTIRVSSSGV